MPKGGRPPQRRVEVLMWLREHPGLHSVEEISQGVSYTPSNVRVILKKLIEMGQVVRGAFGKYTAI